jgi:PKD repeat protein
MRKKRFPILLGLLAITLIFVVSACNLGTTSEESVDITELPTETAAVATRTLLPDGTIPTSVGATVTQIPLPTTIQNTSVAILPPTSALPPRATNTPTPISILILAPAPGSTVSGNVQILGSAIHPSFLQYRLEYGPEPNPSNLWFPITGIVQSPVLNSVLGIWNTNTASSPDGTYQIRLRVFLRDGRQETTVINGIRIQNRQPTAVPTNTPTVPRPIAAFTQDITTGNAPLVVRFTNQSSGQITSYSWDFGDGSNTTAVNPTHTFSNPGIYNVTLRATGPGGTANVTRQINVTSAAAPTAGFITNTTSGEAPLSVSFTNQSTGSITSYTWDFGDGSTSNEVNPTYTFNDVGTYNVILTATGPGGSSNVVRQITVENPQVPAPIAGFSASILTGERPLTVDFTDSSQGDITQYLWDFNGDGITDSTDASPSHTYNDAGTFNVRLTVIGDGGQNTTNTDIVVQEPPNAPTADFSVNNSSGDIPLTVNFTNASSGEITGYAWDFDNDGITDSTDENPSHTYADAGTYTAVLSVTGPGGTTTTQTTINATTPIIPPTANFTTDVTTGEAPLTVAFTNTSDGSDLTYAWDFDNDGVIDSNVSSPSHEYATAGQYTAVLSITNDAGTDSAQVTINVSESVAQVVAPVASFTTDVNTGTAPLTVTFTSNSTGTIDSFAWDFDSDGIADNTTDNPATFTYNTAGTFNASLTVSNSAGSNTIAIPITVTEALVAPVASFTTDVNTGSSPLTVTFTSSSTGTIDSFAWDFDGDGVADNTTDNPATFTYNTAGTFNASLTVTNGAGSDTIALPITVTEALVAPVASFTTDVNTGTAPLMVTFTSSSTGTIDSFAWDFDGDGVADNTTDNPASFTYNTAGTFNASLTVTNGAGSDTIALPITVTEALVAPVASFTTDVNTGTAPLMVTFTSTSTGTIDSFAWDFDGDGVADNTTDNPATFTYNTAGTFNASLTVTNGAGSDTIALPITVTEALVAPVASFTTDVNTGTAPLTVTFTSNSTGTVDSFAWDFDGDGVADNTTDNPASFTYNTAGTFNASLTVTNGAGSDTIALPITVTEALVAPVASFTTDVNTGTAPLTVTFTSNSTGTIDSFAWDFNGDGVADNTTDNPASFTYNTAGTFNASLTVTNGAGSDTIALPITVTEALVAPVASFTTNVNTGTAPLMVTFTSNSTGTIDSFAWDFDGDGVADNTTDNPASFTYNTAGTFNASLTVTNGAGSDTISLPITVNAALVAPVASFTTDINTGTAPLTVTFTSTSTGTVDSFAWDFNGDGVADNTTDNPTVFTYDTAGTFNASLTVTNGAGSNTSSATITVEAAVVTPPSGDIALTVDVGGNNEIFLINADGTGGTNITNNGANDRDPVWSPDGSKIAFVSNRNGASDIFVYTLADQSLQTLTQAAGENINPAWRGDGSQIIFSSNRDGTYDLFAMNADGSNVVKLPSSDTANETQPSWSPDGNRVLFVSDASGNNDITVMNNDGSNMLALTIDGSNDEHPRWKPDGSSVVFMSERAGDRDIFSVNVDGSNLVQLTFDASNEEEPSYAPDGNTIYFTSDRTADKNIFTMNADGTNVVQLTNATVNESQAHRR